MRIVFTGATSFSGLGFVQELVQQGHEVFMLIQNEREAYEGLRKSRLEILEKIATPLFGCVFGSENYFKKLEEIPSFDLFCHHAADVTNYKSPDFNAALALQKNTFNLTKTLELLQRKNCSTFLLTGSIFEPGEGAGSDDLRAVSPYGLSKGLTSDFISYYTKLYHIRFKKFVIPNPFGPYEEVRFTTFLAKTWLENKVAPITMPSYVRDNIPISLLAKAYAQFAADDETKINPSFYVDSQGAFTHRFHLAMKKRLPSLCEYNILEQIDFNEPLVRVNTDPLKPQDFDWNEEKAWDDLANFYLKTYAK